MRLTFAGTAEERATAVRFWGFQAPFGAWVCIWGAFAMLTSAPFDDWWHNTYGLDVKILSPPHAILAAGIGAIQIGAMLMVVAWQNRGGGRSPRFQQLFLYSAGLMLLNIATLSTEYIGRWDMHQSLFYQVACGVFPFVLVSAARASSARWPATTVAAVYSAITMLMLWALPLFEGRPLLGPIYVQMRPQPRPSTSGFRRCRRGDTACTPTSCTRVATHKPSSPAQRSATRVRPQAVRIPMIVGRLMR